MVGHGNDPLKDFHYDENTLEEYVLGQLLPDEEDTIRQHISHCPLCRARVTDIQVFCRELTSELRSTLEQPQPGPALSFDHIAPEWRKPPRRVTLLYRLEQVMPSASSVFFIGLLVAAFLLLIPSSDTVALRSLELVKNYQGPPAVVAASTDSGLIIVQLSSGSGAQVIDHLSYLDNPRNLQISPDGHWLALQQGRTLHIIAIEHSSIRAHMRIPLNETADWAWSPDSQTLAYTDGAGQLAIFDTATQTHYVLVPADEHAWGKPVWSNDSRQIAYASVEPLPTVDATPSRQSIWRVNPATGYRVELAHNPNPGESLLLATAWSQNADALLVWDINTSTGGNLPTIYRLDVLAHRLESVAGQSLAQGNQLAWPVSSRSITFAVNQDQLTTLDLSRGTQTPILDAIPWPQNLAWSPNGAWAAYTVPGAAGGKGLYQYAVFEGEFRQIELPGGATEKAVSWAGPEHLFVIRQPHNTSFCELWIVPLTTGEAPQRILTYARLPQTGPYIGWRWQDVLAMQVTAR
ncbi:MAG: PD40 domain-containing protein [Anaerolineae bacterium]|nr:PD40 domain-containing protein [Anaerolineae bacterium]